MERSEVKALCEREIGALVRQLGIPHWNIRVTYQGAPADDDGSITRGECHRLVDYEDATITLNPDAVADEGDARKVLRHELFHIVLSPFDLYTQSVDKLGLDETTQRVIDRIWYHAVEKCVINLERMFRGLTAEA